VIVRGRDLHDLVVLHVEREIAADATVRADGVGLCLSSLVPRAGGPHVELALERQCTRRAHGDAVSAVDARRVGERHRKLSGDARVETSTGYADRECVLPLVAAGVHALVAEDALAVVANVKIVVDLHRLVHVGRFAAVGHVVLTR
jgi:hypothetical protein